MSYYEQPNSFQPSTVTIQKWLATKKKSITFNNLILPGYFNSDRNIQRWLIFVATLIELVAFAFTIIGGYEKSVMKQNKFFLIGAIVVAVLFVLLDFIGVYFYHLKDVQILKNKNQIFASSNENHIGLLRLELSKFNLSRFIAYVLLILSALLKILALALLISFFKNFFLVAVIGIFYCFVIYIHASQTGYLLKEVRFKRSLRQDYKEYLETANTHSVKHAAQSYVHNFQVKFQIHGLIMKQPKHVASHSLEYLGIDPITQLHSYQLRCVGLLWDEHIVTFCNGLLQQEKDLVAVECLNLQLTQ